MNHRTANIPHVFALKNFINKGGKEEKKLINSFDNWLKSTELLRKEIADNQPVHYELLATFLREFLEYLEDQSSLISHGSKFRDIRDCISRIKDTLTKLQTVFLLVEKHLLLTTNIKIQCYSIFLQLMSSFLGFKFFDFIESTIRKQLKDSISHFSEPSHDLIAFSRYFVDIGWMPLYSNLLEPSWIVDGQFGQATFILEELKTIPKYLIKETTCQFGSIDLEIYAKKVILCMNKLALYLYPEECFDICRTVGLFTFGSPEFHKKMMAQKIINCYGMNSESSDLQQIYYSSESTAANMYNVNLEISKLCIDILLQSASDFEFPLISMFAFFEYKTETIEYTNYQFVLDDFTTSQFLKLIVKHVLNYAQKKSQLQTKKEPMLNAQCQKIAINTKLWYKVVGKFLNKTSLIEPFIIKFFEDWVLKQIVKGELDLKVVEEVLEFPRVGKFSELFTFTKVVQFSEMSLKSTLKKLKCSATDKIYKNEFELMKLPASLFPKISTPKNITLPFELPLKWSLDSILHEINVPSSNYDDKLMSVKLTNQPYLHRVLLKSNIFRKPLLLNLNLFHAIILDVLFTNRLTCSLSEMNCYLQITNVSSFKNLLSSLVKYGILIETDSSVYSVNTKFKPNPKLVRNNVLCLP